MNSFRVTFTQDEVEIFKKHELIILNNERNYKYSYYKRKHIFDWGVPTKFRCYDFYWEGKSWKNLLIEFALWYISLGFNVETLTNIKSSFSKQYIFSYSNKTNHYGPLNNGLFINGNRSSTHIWWTLTDLIDNLDEKHKTNTVLLVHYPSAIEPKEIIKIIWDKETKMFINYLISLGYSETIAYEYLDNVKRLNNIYRKVTPNYYFFVIDRKIDLFNAVSKIKKNELFMIKEKNFTLTIENVIEFKKEIFYEDCCF